VRPQAQDQPDGNGKKKEGTPIKGTLPHKSWWRLSTNRNGVCCQTKGEDCGDGFGILTTALYIKEVAGPLLYGLLGRSWVGWGFGHRAGFEKSVRRNSEKRGKVKDRMCEDNAYK